MYKYILLLCLLVPGFAVAQIYNNAILNLTLDPDQAPSQILKLNSNYNLGSNALTGKFYNALLNTNFIGDDAKNSPLPYLKTNNNDLGLYLDNNLFYSWKPANKDIYFDISLSSRIQYTANFSADAYKLALFGNEMFAGQTADISGFNFTHYAYQSLQFGFFKYKTQAGNNTLLYGGGISIVSGAGYNSFSIPKGTLYTSPQGDSLSVDAKVSSKAVSSASMITDINGVGASINGFVAMRFSNNDELRFQMADLGFVDWFKNTSQFNINKQISYTGEKVSVINGKTTFTQYYLAFDTIANQVGNSSTGGSFISGLPFQLRLMYTKDLSSSLELTGGLEYIHDNMQIPEFDFSVRKTMLQKRLSARLGLSLFGYGTYGITAGVEYNLTKNLNLTIGTQHFEGLFPVSGTFGQGYYASLKYIL